MKINKSKILELVKSAKPSYKNIIVYHGTAKSFLTSIFKTGLSPRINKYEKMWADKHNYTYDAEAAKNNKALYVATNLETAKEFGKGGTGYSYKGRDSVVLAFKLLPSDIVDGAEKGPGFIENELLIRNVIKPSRLKIVYPKGFSLKDIQQKADSSKLKTIRIKAINKIINNPKWKVASGSNKSSLVHLKGKPSNTRLASFKMEDLVDNLKKELVVEDWNSTDGDFDIKIKVTNNQIKQIQKILKS